MVSGRADEAFLRTHPDAAPRRLQAAAAVLAVRRKDAAAAAAAAAGSSQPQVDAGAVKRGRYLGQLVLRGEGGSERCVWVTLVQDRQRHTYGRRTPAGRRRRGERLTVHELPSLPVLRQAHHTTLAATGRTPTPGQTAHSLRATRPLSPGRPLTDVEFSSWLAAEEAAAPHDQIVLDLLGASLAALAGPGSERERAAVAVLAARQHAEASNLTAARRLLLQVGPWARLPPAQGLLGGRAHVAPPSGAPATCGRAVARVPGHAFSRAAPPPF